MCCKFLFCTGTEKVNKIIENALYVALLSVQWDYPDNSFNIYRRVTCVLEEENMSRRIQESQCVDMYTEMTADLDAPNENTNVYYFKTL